jgi:hypothetical protein
MNFDNRISSVYHYENGKIHRKNGPAIYSPETIYSLFENNNMWFISDKIMTKTEHASYYSVNDHVCNDVSFIISEFASDYKEFS